MSETTTHGSSIRVTRDGDDLILRRRAGSFAFGGLLLAYLAIWSVGCITTASEALDHPSIGTFLSSIPVWASWGLLLYWTVWMLFGRERLKVGPDGIDYELRSLLTLERRHVPLAEVRAVVPLATTVSLENVGHPLRFGRFRQGLDPEERDRLADLLRQHIRALTPDRVVASQVETRKATEVLQPAATAIAPPSDSLFRLDPSDRGITLTWRGRFSLAILGGIAYTNCLWNGIVGYAVLGLMDDIHRLYLICLIPHVIIGLFLLYGLWTALTAPFLEQRWSFGRDEVSTRSSLFGFGRTKHFDPSEVGRIELRATVLQHRPEERVYALGLVDRYGDDLFAIEGLSEGEARWMGAEICGMLPKGGEAASVPPEGRGSLYDPWLDS